MVSRNELDMDSVAGRWRLQIISGRDGSSREISSQMEIEFEADGNYVIRSAASSPIEGSLQVDNQGANRTVASGVSFPARSLRVEGDTLYWTLSDGADLVFTRAVDA
tara:strand:- start:3060 stop:3380 length:321 start_codon:yes stop_codon:yes gene_type:complete